MAASKERRAAQAGAARETVRTRELREMEANGAGVLNVMFALEDAAEDNKTIPRMVTAAKLFLITVLFVAPVLLMWQHAF